MNSTSTFWNEVGAAFAAVALTLFCICIIFTFISSSILVIYKLYYHCGCDRYFRSRNEFSYEEIFSSRE